MEAAGTKSSEKERSHSYSLKGLNSASNKEVLGSESAHPPNACPSVSRWQLSLVGNSVDFVRL